MKAFKQFLNESNKSISGLREGKDYFYGGVVKDKNGNVFHTYIPVTHYAISILASQKVGGIKADWFIAEENKNWRFNKYKIYATFLVLVDYKNHNKFLYEFYHRTVFPGSIYLLNVRGINVVKNIDDYFNTKELDSIVNKYKMKVFKKYKALNPYVIASIIKDDFKYLDQEDLNFWVDRLTKLKKCCSACLFLLERVPNLPKNIFAKLEDAIIEKDDDGRICYLLAREIKGADIKRLQDVVIQKDKNGWVCYQFAKYVKGADIKRLSEVVAQKDEEGEWILEFAKHFGKKANLSLLLNRIIEIGNEKLVFDFIFLVEGFGKTDIKTIEDYVIEHDKIGGKCVGIATHIKGANIKRLEDVVIQRDKTGEWSYFFARNVKSANIKRLKDAVIQKDKNGIWISRFKKYVEKGEKIK